MSQTDDHSKMAVLSVPEAWQPNFDLKEANIEQKIMDPPPSHESLQCLLMRGVNNFPADIKLKVELFGIYGIPEEWSNKIVSKIQIFVTVIFRRTLPNKPSRMK